MPEVRRAVYITDSGTFRCIKSAPCLHKAKYDTQADLHRRDMRDKFYYAMWNWIRRYWRNIGKAKDIAPQTVAAYERALDKQAEEIADLGVSSFFSDTMARHSGCLRLSRYR